jgi:hypothetical protein
MRPSAPDFFVLQPPREVPLPSSRSVDEALTQMAIAEAEALAPAQRLEEDEYRAAMAPIGRSSDRLVAAAAFGRWADDLVAAHPFERRPAHDHVAAAPFARATEDLALPGRSPHPSVVDDALVFVPRSVPVGPSQEPAPPRYASRVVAAVLAAAAGFALASGLGKRATPRLQPSLAPVRTAATAASTAAKDAAPAPGQPLRRESGTLREAPLTVRVAATAAPAAPVPSTGVLNTPESAHGHRVFVDGRCRGGAGDPIRLPCGPHEVRVGSAGRKQQVVVPCGGEIDVSR